MEDSYSRRDSIWSRISTNCDNKVQSKLANKKTQEPTLASKMDRVVSICCMRRDMLASFCRNEEKMCDQLKLQMQKIDTRKKTCTNLFTNYSKTVDESYCVHHKLVEKGDDSSLLNSWDLKETHVQRCYEIKSCSLHI